VTAPERTACIQCDLPLSVRALGNGERARCPRCRHTIAAGSERRFDSALAFAVAATVFLILANAYPFLRMQSSGLESVMTLPGTALELHRQGYLLLAVIVLSAIVVIPTAMLLAIFSLALPLRSGRRQPWLVGAGRFLFAMSPWAMVEVFIIGVIVSLVKIGSLATVILGTSFWSYVGFAICFTAALSYLDRFSVWREIEAARP